jgi:hypothetical protein
MRSGQSAQATLRQALVLSGLLLGSSCGGRTSGPASGSSGTGASTSSTGVSADSSGGSTSTSGAVEAGVGPDALPSCIISASNYEAVLATDTCEAETARVAPWYSAHKLAAWS